MHGVHFVRKGITLYLISAITKIIIRGQDRFGKKVKILRKFSAVIGYFRSYYYY